MIAINSKLRKAGALISEIMQRETYDLSENESKSQNGKASEDTLVLPEAVSLKGRQCLDMSVSELNDVPKKVFRDINLRILKLNGNFLRCLPLELSKLRNLEELYLQNNQLEFLPAQVCALVNLEVLDISYNEINMLPYSISHLKNLRVLDIAYNNFKLLPESLHFLQSLEVLNIDGNKTGQWNDAIFSLHNLVVLKSRGNDLTTIPKHISKLKRLKELCISDNKITKLPDAVKGFLRRIEHLEVDNELRTRELTMSSTSPLLNCLKGDSRSTGSNEIYFEPKRRYSEGDMISSTHHKVIDTSYDEDDENPVYHFQSYAFPGAQRSPEKETAI